jgi:cytoskeletal protein CcmA (bactofilin family)
MFGSKTTKSKAVGSAQGPVSSSHQQAGDSFVMAKDNAAHAPVSSIVAEGVLIEGKFTSASHIFVHGEIVGEVKAPSINFGRSGRMSGSLTCEMATIDGSFEGELMCAEAVLGAHSKVHGKVTCKVLKVAVGALITGDISVDETSPCKN